MKTLLLAEKSFTINHARVAELADLPAGRKARTRKIMYYVYALKSLAREYIYVGLTGNIERRIAEHNGGKERTTRAYAPFETILVEKCDSGMEARKKEKYFKSGAGKEYLKSL